MKYFDVWQGENGLRNAFASRFAHKGVFPERPGFDPLAELREMLPAYHTVIEIGCGFGRLAEAFLPAHYMGIDINVAAIEAAKARLPEYVFCMMAPDYYMPPSMAKFAYTVAMHVPDDEYPDFVRGLCESTSDQVVIAERLGSHLRHDLKVKDDGILQPAFGREMHEHEKEFAKWDFDLVTYRERPYFKGGLFTFIDFRKRP